MQGVTAERGFQYEVYSHDVVQRVHVPNNVVLGIRVIAIIVLVLGKYMIIGYLEP